MKYSNFGMAISLNFLKICEELEQNNNDANETITEFTASLSFLKRKYLPVVAISLYLSDMQTRLKSSF